jgi:hypothetical protein
VLLAGYLVCLRGATLVEEEALRVGVGEFHGGIEALTFMMDQETAPDACYGADELYLLKDGP